MAIILQFPGPSATIKSPRKRSSKPAIPDVLLEEIAAIAMCGASPLSTRRTFREARGTISMPGRSASQTERREARTISSMIC